MANRPINDPRTIEEVLNTKDRIAVVGLSPKPERDSYKVGEYLIEHGFDIVPVRPKAEEVLGRKNYESLKDIPGGVEVVDVFLNPANIGPVVEAAIETGAKYLWLQLGVVNREEAEKAREAGLNVVMDRCMKREHQRRSG